MACYIGNNVGMATVLMMTMVVVIVVVIVVAWSGAGCVVVVIIDGQAKFLCMLYCCRYMAYGRGHILACR